MSTSDVDTFLSTLPARGATYTRYLWSDIIRISIHAPREGSDRMRCLGPFHAPISIHAPREGSDPNRSAAPELLPISIHAPREGSDTACRISFRPRDSFLSTLPARGATQIIPPVLYSNPISIHAPREGSDLSNILTLLPYIDFYPRSPRGERPAGGLTSGAGLPPFLSTLPARGATPPSRCRRRRLLQISIHAPREGSDPVRKVVLVPGLGISIHAPREGSDITVSEGG